MVQARGGRPMALPASTMALALLSCSGAGRGLLLLRGHTQRVQLLRTGRTSRRSGGSGGGGLDGRRCDHRVDRVAGQRGAGEGEHAGNRERGRGGYSVKTGTGGCARADTVDVDHE